MPALRIDPALSAPAHDWAATRAAAGDAAHNMRLGHLVTGASKLGEIIGRVPTWTPPADLTASRAQVSARHVDPQGQSGRVFCWLLDAGRRIAAQGWIGPVCSGCTATLALPALAPGTYEVFAYSTDGTASPFAGPVALTV